ncbi:UDP-N-acetylmuramoyl-tripeptide--D-alanyl-D-alanine ligase [Marichromatium gracile]|uniref:UDP-N-acetylmuramoyl-tripeptide--D-alanyl-D-alanine ligase n=1 Tax=Marichromatium gracile TaxID=1048 RepID=A0ABR5VD85_MARGR|nr:UDP-N-acetylmuramoyl-tripeptide--D-alanyl-D-alanine ligase [Marichromatium gracile]KXX63653.1 UDP-N-acetylmuramoylalanyl-D-glutamate--2,6-diaminopimelate ligase [Marichromatium gracile]
MWTLGEAVAAAGGRLQGTDCRFDGVGTDSRVDCSGQLFVALRGPRFDGHEHVEAARRAGAVAALVDHPVAVDLPQWVVDDTRLGLGRLAHAWRARLRARVVAITGSNGKTTAKEMVAAILGQAGRVHATRGNLNNDIGMPLTLLGARDEDFLVLEMGANHPGEIGYMTDIARPDVALITNAGRAHLEGFGSLEGVARAKGEIARGLLPHGILVVPEDSPYTGLWRELAFAQRVSTFAIDDGPRTAATVRPALRAERPEITAEWDAQGFRTRFVAHYGGESHALALPLAGEHNVRNALAAIAVALALRVEGEAIRDGLAALRPVPGRLCPRLCGTGRLHLIDDTYNANPDSIAAAIAVLAAFAGRRWLVLGDLGELGPEAESLHREIGEQARAAGIERLAAVGPLSAAAVDGFGAGGEHFADQAALIAALRAELGEADRVLIKGSRTARMECIVEALCAAGGDEFAAVSD